MQFTGWSPLRVFGRDVLSAFVPRWIRTPWRAAVNGFTPAWRRRGVKRDFAKAAFTRGAVDRRRLRDGYRPGARWRDRWIEMCRLASSDGTGCNYGATTPDLELTRPFHDKRIVEFALALPDRLLFRDGRERWLARRAFADILPAALASRMPGNDREQPDMLAMYHEAAPGMLAALSGLEQDEAVSRYVDLRALAAMVRESASEERLSERVRLDFAMQALATARFLAWMDRGNR